MNTNVLNWLGIRFTRGGATRGEGLDCLGLSLMYLREEGGRTVPDVNVSRIEDVPSEVWGSFRELPLEGPFEPYDILITRGTLQVDGRTVVTRHVGVVTPLGGVLTTTEETGSICMPESLFRQRELLEAWRCRS